MKLTQNIGKTINGFELLDVYNVITTNGKKMRRMKVRCVDCGAILERSAHLGEFNHIRCKCRCKYSKPKKEKYHYIEYHGEKYNVTEFCRKYNLNANTFSSRINRGMSVEEAMQKTFVHECVICHDKFLTDRPFAKYCSKTCLNRGVHGDGEYKLYVKECPYCKQFFITNLGYKKMCSKRCQDKTSVITRTNRYNDLKRSGKFDASVTLKDVYEKDKGICQICGKKLNFRGKKTSGKYPSIDHIIPISRGGTHTWDNVQLLCRCCNEKKGAN